MIDLPIQPPDQALVYLTESRYGFALVDIGLTEYDLALFDQFQIKTTKTSNWFGPVENFQKGILSYLETIGEGPIDFISERILEITDQVLSSSSRRFAWFSLKSTLPNEGTWRWHIDGKHFMGKDLQYKFCMTLKGAPTLFYLLPTEKNQIRKIFWSNMQNKAFTNEFCEENFYFMPERQEGAFFILGQAEKGAVHTEPAVVEPRLFFSIVPCEEKDLKSLQERVRSYYPDSKNENF